MGDADAVDIGESANLTTGNGSYVVITMRLTKILLGNNIVITMRAMRVTVRPIGTRVLGRRLREHAEPCAAKYWRGG